MSKRSYPENITKESFETLYGAADDDRDMSLPTNKSNSTKKRSGKGADLNKFTSVEPFVKLYGMTVSEQENMKRAYEACDGSRPMTRQRKGDLLQKTSGKKSRVNA